MEQEEQERHRREMEQALQEEVFANRESEKKHSRYAKELRFNHLIKDGEVETLKKAFAFITEMNNGKMSRSPLRQQLYEFIVGVTLATRYAMDGGLDENEAYTLSDVYVQKAEACLTSREIWNLYMKMVLDYAQRVNGLEKRKVLSAPVQEGVNYILRQLHYEIEVEEVAKVAGFSPNYFNNLFKKETGVTIKEFILQNRIKEAANLLKYSEYTVAEVSQYLGFCSQSHFSAVFHKYANITPSQYRKQHMRKEW